jgi:hypothetical protein
MNDENPTMTGEQRAHLLDEISTAIEFEDITVDGYAPFNHLTAAYSTRLPQTYLPYTYQLNTQAFPVEAHGQPVHMIGHPMPPYVHEACSPVYEIGSPVHMVASPAVQPRNMNQQEQETDWIRTPGKGVPNNPELEAWLDQE